MGSHKKEISKEDVIVHKKYPIQMLNQNKKNKDVYFRAN